MVANPKNLTSSFRDPSGFIFEKEGKIYRQINQSGRENYDRLMETGLFKKLLNQELIINHQEVKNITFSRPGYKIIQPDKIPFITYPYEWCFSQLKDAALATLKIQKISLDNGMSLKDASSYNIQLFKGHPVLIDTLSFERYQEGQPWVAYRQFCQHFLAPLALMSHLDLRLGMLLKDFIDGIPIDLAARLLRGKSWFSLGLLTHLHLHARSQKSSSKSPSKQKYHLSKPQLLAILNNLEATIRSLKLPKQKTVWQDYYQMTNYTPRARANKEKLVSLWIKKTNPAILWDAGANNAFFSRLASKKKILAIATDLDHLAVEQAYERVKKTDDQYLLPLIVDLINPSPSIGWSNQERPSFLKRSSFDLTLCLAFLHHLAIANNLPFSLIAQMFSEHTKHLVIEFVPKVDSNAKRLLQNREDIFDQYYQGEFEQQFSKYFMIKERASIDQSLRVIYLMTRKD